MRGAAAAAFALLLADRGRRRGARAQEAKTLSDADIRRLEELFQQAVDSTSGPEEESAWDSILKEYGQFPQIEARISVNRGNARARQGKFDGAIADYSRGIELAPGEANGYVNRGASYEALGRFQDALDDYTIAINLDPEDPAAWNNRGNALLKVGRYADARDSFKTALSYASNGPQSYAFASLNLNLAEFELGNDNAAIKDVRSLLTRYADGFPEARALYALMLWDRGDRVAAESEWDRATASDPRYRSLSWVTEVRQWPARISKVLRTFSETTKVKVK